MADNGKQRLIFVVIAGVSFLLAILMGFIPPFLSPVALVISLVALGGAIIAFMTKDYFYMMTPLQHMKNGTATIDAEDPFYISLNGNAIVTRREDLVYATAFIRIPVYVSSTEMSDEDKFNFSNIFARIVSISKIPMRISAQLYSINKDEYISRISSKLNEAESRYNTVLGDKSSPQRSIDRVKGEVTMWHNMLDNVSRSNSQALDIYASVTSVGNSEDEAVNLVSLKSDELAAGISATIGVQATVVTGNAMLVYIEPDFMIPPATISELMRYRSNTTNSV